MNIKQRIRLTESQLHQVIKESVKRVLKEMDGERNACPYGCWDYDRCKAEANKYKGRNEFTI